MTVIIPAGFDGCKRLRSLPVRTFGYDDLLQMYIGVHSLGEFRVQSGER
jgi:hypothetical protein